MQRKHKKKSEDVHSSLKKTTILCLTELFDLDHDLDDRESS